jgi:hypothetical protein
VKAMRDHDEAMIKRWNEELDTLLVFVSILKILTLLVLC